MGHPGPGKKTGSLGHGAPGPRLHRPLRERPAAFTADNIPGNKGWAVRRHWGDLALDREMGECATPPSSGLSFPRGKVPLRTRISTWTGKNKYKQGLLSRDLWRPSELEASLLECPWICPQAPASLSDSCCWKGIGWGHLFFLPLPHPSPSTKHRG